MRWPAAPQAILGAITLAILPMGKWLSPMGEQLFSMDTSNRTKELPKRLNQSRKSERYQAVEITCCLRAVLVLAANPTRKFAFLSSANEVEVFPFQFQTKKAKIKG